MSQSNRVPETLPEWNTLIDSLLALPQPLTKEDIEKHIQLLSYDSDAVVNLMVGSARMYQQVLCVLGAITGDTSTGEEVIDDQD